LNIDSPIECISMRTKSLLAVILFIHLKIIKAI